MSTEKSQDAMTAGETIHPGAPPPGPGRPDRHDGNAALYGRGRQAADRIARRIALGVGPGAACREVAAESGLDVERLRAAVDFAVAVDKIAADVGPAARTPILGGHRHLTPKRVMQINRTHPERQRFAMAQVALDRHPFAKARGGEAEPFDTLGYGEVTNRLSRFAGLLDRVADGLADTPPADWPAISTLHRISVRNAAVRESCAEMRVAMEESRARVGLAHVRVRGRRGRPSSTPAPYRPERAFTSVSGVLGVMEKNARDLPRLLRESPPTAQECASVLAGLRRMDATATRLSGIIRGQVQPKSPRVDRGLPDVERGVAAAVAGTGHVVPVVEAPDGPADWGGTYIVAYHLDAATDVVVGCGRTFTLPPGYHLYVGSQHGVEGVRGRTRRHRTPVKARSKWNIDYLTPYARAVELWWTYDPIKRECTWSSVLGASPGFDCPAPGFGSNDCREIRAAGFGSPDGRLCRGHLHHSMSPPDVRGFARRLGRLVPGHAPVFRQRLDLGERGGGIFHPSGGAA